MGGNIGKRFRNNVNSLLHKSSGALISAPKCIGPFSALCHKTTEMMMSIPLITKNRVTLDMELSYPHNYDGLKLHPYQLFMNLRRTQFWRDYFLPKEEMLLMCFPFTLLKMISTCQVLDIVETHGIVQKFVRRHCCLKDDTAQSLDASHLSFSKWLNFCTFAPEYNC